MSSTQNVIFRNVQVIDGNEDEAFTADVLVRDGEIAAVERGGDLPEADDNCAVWVAVDAMDPVSV